MPKQRRSEYFYLIDAVERKAVELTQARGALVDMVSAAQELDRHRETATAKAMTVPSYMRYLKERCQQEREAEQA